MHSMKYINFLIVNLKLLFIQIVVKAKYIMELIKKKTKELLRLIFNKKPWLNSKEKWKNIINKWNKYRIKRLKENNKLLLKWNKVKKR